ncbi:hypothetical protein AYK26_07660 [Euryarchaeota archaeon SM23-78]|nr:MAG: hypothetical protein AYK26_07660 [Euryarchaeota archaeon SM23-78]
MNILLVSIPKAGMHMFTQVVGMPHENIPYGSLIYSEAPHETTLNQIENFTGFGRTHIGYHPSYEKAISKRNLKTIFLYRDPRDLMVSYYHWIKALGHRGQSIPGLWWEVSPILDSEDPFMEMIPDWGAFIRRYIPWLFTPGIFALKYEDFISNFVRTFQEINWWLGEEPYGTASQMAARINPDTCPGFRKGVIGDWKGHFKEHHIRAFDDILGETMEFLGYEY